MVLSLLNGGADNKSRSGSKTHNLMYHHSKRVGNTGAAPSYGF